MTIPSNFLTDTLKPSQRLGKSITVTNIIENVSKDLHKIWDRINTNPSFNLSLPLSAKYGGTGLDSSSSTGVAQVVLGTWSISTALANGTTGTTQTAGDNSTLLATTAYVDSAITTASAETLSPLLLMGG